MYLIYDPRAGGVLNGCKEDHARTGKQYFYLTYSRKIERSDGLSHCQHYFVENYYIFDKVRVVLIYYQNLLTLTLTAASRLGLFSFKHFSSAPEQINAVNDIIMKNNNIWRLLPNVLPLSSLLLHPGKHCRPLYIKSD